MSQSVSLLVALFAFAANSFFCRFALAEQSIDPGSFTLIRLLSGAVTLVAVMAVKGQIERSFLTDKLSWWSGIALFGYAVTFSFAYTQLTTGTGALILFGMVQLTLVVFHVYSGHRLNRIEWLGVATALSGFVFLMLPSAQTPSLTAAIIMLLSGVGWAIFTMLGRLGGAPAKAITHGFVLASVIALCVSPWLFSPKSITVQGAGWALLSGIFASGFGYIVWYQVVKRMSVLQASIAQLAVPVIAFAAGSVGLAESVSLTAIISSLLVLGGIGMVFVAKLQP